MGLTLGGADIGFRVNGSALVDRYGKVSNGAIESVTFEVDLGADLRAKIGADAGGLFVKIGLDEPIRLGNVVTDALLDYLEFLNPAFANVDYNLLDALGQALDEFESISGDLIENGSSRELDIAFQLLYNELVTNPIYGFAQNWPDHFSQCFLAGTSVLVNDASMKAIESIRPGDSVLSYDATGMLVSGRVARTFVNEVSHLLDVHGLKVTPTMRSGPMQAMTRFLVAPAMI